jgi:hypothetical protein
MKVIPSIEAFFSAVGAGIKSFAIAHNHSFLVICGFIAGQVVFFFFHL